VHDRAEDLQGLAPAAARGRRFAAAAAALIAAPALAAAEPTEAPKPAVVRHGWQLDLSGYVQVDARLYDQESVDELDPSTGEPLSTEKLSIRAARLRAEAKRGGVFGLLELDGNTQDRPTARIRSAQVGYAYPANDPRITVRAGVFKVPFGVDVPTSERDRLFLEPTSFAQALFPGSYDGGLMVNGRYGLARWTLAVTNGALSGDAQWTGADPSSSYDLVGRVGAVIEGPRRLRVELGVSGLTGEGLHAGTPPTKDGLQWVDENQDGIVQTTELQVVPGSPGLPSEGFDRQALGGDLQVHWCLCKLGTGLAFAEVVAATNLDRGLIYADPIASARDLRELGFTVGAVQNVTPYARVGVRYDRYNGDRDAFQRAGVELVGVDQVFSTLSVMAMGVWHEARFMVQYDRGRNPFGLGDDGTPTTRDADRLTLRAQVGF
jgi:hypothetical protein